MEKSILLLLTGLLCSISVKAQIPAIGPNDSTQYILICPIEPQPSFPGGYDAFKLFLQKNLKNPDPQLDVQGRVIISFIVEKNGSLTHFEIKRGLQNKFNEEALRVLKLSPKWIPVKLNGKPIRSGYTVPINFTLGQ